MMEHEASARFENEDDIHAPVSIAHGECLNWKSLVVSGSVYQTKRLFSNGFIAHDSWRQCFQRAWRAAPCTRRGLPCAPPWLASSASASEELGAASGLDACRRPRVASRARPPAPAVPSGTTASIGPQSHRKINTLMVKRVFYYSKFSVKL